MPDKVYTVEFVEGGIWDTADVAGKNILEALISFTENHPTCEVVAIEDTERV